jgi:hypothetical protein
MKAETYQRLKDLHKGIIKPKVSISKAIGDFLIVRKSFGNINFKTYEDAEKGINELLKAGWDIRVNIDGGKVARRKTTKGIMDNIKSK